MTETELQSRLAASVADVEAPLDLVNRVRAGGTRRLRQRRIYLVASMAVALVAVGGLANAAAGIERFDAQADAAANAKTTMDSHDPYAYFLNRPTKGDLANDKDYLNSVIRAWDRSHAKSGNASRGIFNHLKGKARVVWAGNTPAGPAAMVIQRADVRHHGNIQLNREGLYTLAGFVGTGANGKPEVVGDTFPSPDSGRASTAFRVGPDREALVVIDTGQRAVGFSPQREYPATGGSTRTYQPLTFEQGAAVVALPPGTTAPDLRVSSLPASQSGRIPVTGLEAFSSDRGNVKMPDNRLWMNVTPYAGLPAATGLRRLTQLERDAFDQAVVKISDPMTYSASHSFWYAYANTPNGDRVVVGEYQIDDDPTRIYAHITNANGKSKVISAGIPQRDVALPVSIRLPEGQGWLVASNKAQLSYKQPDGSWSKAMPNALLVPDKPGAKVKVKLQGQEQIVSLG